MARYHDLRKPFGKQLAEDIKAAKGKADASHTRPTGEMALGDGGKGQRRRAGFQSGTIY